MAGVGGVEAQQEQLQIIQDKKFLSRLLSKENSAANPSFRVYYGMAAGAVPFIWESQPGTPKHTMAVATLPPLTPPPSYFISTKEKAALARTHKHKLVHALLPKLTLRKPQSPPPPPLSASWSSSSGSHRRGRVSSPMSSFSSNSRGEDDERSPTSTLCFEEQHAGGEVTSCYPVGMMKKALMSIVGHGTAA